MAFRKDCIHDKYRIAYMREHIRQMAETVGMARI